MEDFIGYVYLYIDGTNDFEYVGQTTKTVEKRFKQHAKANTRIGYAIRAHGEDMFVIVILKVCHSKAELDYWERRFIKLRNTKHPNGYNMTDGGDGNSNPSEETRAKISAANKGKHPTPETREKLSAARRGKKLSPETREKISKSKRGEKNPQYGKPHSPEHRAKISVGNMGKKRQPRSPEWCAKISAANRGKKCQPHSPETCKKIGEALRGVPKSPEHRAKIGESQRGKKRGSRPPEVKARISAANTGKKRSQEAIAKMSAAKIGKKQSPEHREKIATAVHSRSQFKNLVAELATRHMSYKDLSELMGREKSYISRRMSEKQAFNDDDKKKLVEIFDKPIEYLLKRDE